MSTLFCTPSQSWGTLTRTSSTFQLLLSCSSTFALRILHVYHFCETNLFYWKVSSRLLVFGRHIADHSPCLRNQPFLSHPSFNQKAAKRIQTPLRERAQPFRLKTSTVSGNIINPKHLLPIHLRTEPLRPLSPTIAECAKQLGARHIAKRRPRDWELHDPEFQDQIRPSLRKKSKFVDDSAVEVDSEGQDIQWTATTPLNTPPTTLFEAGASPIAFALQVFLK